MTDENRAELRKLIGQLVRAVELPEAAVGGVADRPNVEDGYVLREWGVSVHVVAAHDTDGELPELTTAQQLALSVLLGDEAVIPGHLADLLLDQGHEYATACYDRGKREAVEAMMQGWMRGDGHTLNVIHIAPEYTQCDFTPTVTPPG